jgi:DNA gyrase subunit B
MEEYTAEQIEVLSDLEAVRKRPGMYIGGVGVRGLHHLLWEIVDNSIDEALAGYCDKITVVLHKDGSASVEDNGRGIPVEKHPVLKKSALEVVMTKLHAGGKFSKKAYKVSGGLHGVGLSVVNALSEWLEVWVKRNGKVYYQRYERGKPVTELKVVGEAKDTGTKIRFKPDPEIFEVTEFNYEIVAQRLRELAFLNKGIRITLIDERTGKRDEFYSEEGIKGFVALLNKNKPVLHDIIYFSGEKNGIMVEVALQFTDTEFETLFAFANNIHTVEGGTHVVGFRAGLTRAINEYGKKNIKKFKPITGVDIREGLTAVISVKVPEPQFEGQTKTKLTNSDVKTVVESLTYSEVLRWLEEHPNEASKIIEKCLLAMKAREAARRARELVRRKSEISITLPGKLADCSSKNPEERELFIVEGESAGGSAKQARDRRFQAVLPIRGKIINVEKAGFIRALKNEEIRAIASAIGAGIGKDFDISKARYRRIIIMTDADVDGAHIRTLLLTFFYRYMRPLIEHGYLYIAQPPLYRVKKGKKTYYVYSDRELKKLLEKLGDGAEVQRFKGLGEMNPEQLWETTMNPKNRILIQVTIEDALSAEQLFSILMGEDVKARREFIIKHSKEVKNLDV